MVSSLIARFFDFVRRRLRRPPAVISHDPIRAVERQRDAAGAKAPPSEKLAYPFPLGLCRESFEQMRKSGATRCVQLIEGDRDLTVAVLGSILGPLPLSGGTTRVLLSQASDDPRP